MSDPKYAQVGQKVIMHDTTLPKSHNGCSCMCHLSAGVMHSWQCCRKVDDNYDIQASQNRNPQAQ
jgi:hypothetical protein